MQEGNQLRSSEKVLDQHFELSTAAEASLTVFRIASTHQDERNSSTAGFDVKERIRYRPRFVKLYGCLQAVKLDDRATNSHIYAVLHALELFKRIQPADYLSRFLQEGYRPDGRRAEEFREPALNAGMAIFRGPHTGTHLTHFSHPQRLNNISRWFCSSSLRRNNRIVRYQSRSSRTRPPCTK